MNWLPPNGALHGIALDHLMRWNLAILFWLFVASQILIIAAMLRRRSAKKSAASGQQRTTRLFLLAELLPLLAITALYLWMVFTSHKLWAARREGMSNPEAIQVEVTGVQFQWYFRYPGTDAAFGLTRPALIDAAAGNPLGLDPRDPQGRDDIVSSVLMLPVGHEVDLRLRSIDVIHGFFIPGMRLKQNAVPGWVLHVHFTPETPGTYPILCSQVCGLGHARMQATLRVVSQADFDHWIASREHASQAVTP
jgi:cytochrome c oxidase subunit 2